MEELASINRVNLADLEIYENGVRIEVPREKSDRWVFTGLMNTWAIQDRFWELVWERREDVSSDACPPGR